MVMNSQRPVKRLSLQSTRLCRRLGARDRCADAASDVIEEINVVRPLKRSRLWSPPVQPRLREEASERPKRLESGYLTQCSGRLDGPQ